jgi:hypothetical protein
MRFLKKIGGLAELCGLCVPPSDHFKFNACHAQRWHLRVLWRAVFLVALTLAAMARPTLVNAGMEYNERIRFQDDFDACSGERILVDGTQHIVGRVTEDATGRLHFGSTRNTYGTGIGYISGDHYVLTDTVSRSSVEVVTVGAQTYTERYHARLIRRGEATTGDDTLVQFLSKITLNANGDVTASVEIQSVTCG